MRRMRGQDQNRSRRGEDVFQHDPSPSEQPWLCYGRGDALARVRKQGPERGLGGMRLSRLAKGAVRAHLMETPAMTALPYEILSPSDDAMWAAVRASRGPARLQALPP